MNINLMSLKALPLLSALMASFVITPSMAYAGSEHSKNKHKYTHSVTKVQHHKKHAYKHGAQHTRHHRKPHYRNWHENNHGEGHGYKDKHKGHYNQHSNYSHRPHRKYVYVVDNHHRPHHNGFDRLGFMIGLHTNHFGLTFSD